MPDSSCHSLCHPERSRGISAVPLNQLPHGRQRNRPFQMKMQLHFWHRGKRRRHVCARLSGSSTRFLRHDDNTRGSCRRRGCGRQQQRGLQDQDIKAAASARHAPNIRAVRCMRRASLTIGFHIWITGMAEAYHQDRKRNQERRAGDPEHAPGIQILHIQNQIARQRNYRYVEG